MVGDNIKLYREMANLSQKQLGIQLGVTRDIISNWERNITDVPSDYILPLCQVFHCSPVAFVNRDKHSFSWYVNQYKANAGSIEEYAIANPDIMEMELFAANEWDGSYPMLHLMGYYYTQLDEEERSHILYLVGMMFRHKYEFAKRTPLQEKAYKRLTEYEAEWLKLTHKAQEHAKIKHTEV